MNKPCRFLWLEGVFDDTTVNSFLSISPASNYWQKGFVHALRSHGQSVDVVGYPVERVWPFGRLFVRKTHAALFPGFEGRVTGYINLPAVRGFIQYVNLLKAVLSLVLSTGRRPDYAVVFSCLERAEEETPAIRVAKYMREHHDIPWICIVADGATPAGADRYVYLPWANFLSAAPNLKGIHLDGGIADVRRDLVAASETRGEPGTRVLMYMGALTEHGGVIQLVRAFSQLEEKDVQLWICGRGANSELDRLTRTDDRIKLKGFVETDELDRLAHEVFAFVNPRPNSFAPNRLNYPSKLLHYLAYGKPVLSTFTEGVSPEYEEILVPVEDESEAALMAAMRSILAMHRDAYDDICHRIERFNETHTWAYQVNRFRSWLENEERSEPARRIRA